MPVILRVAGYKFFFYQADVANEPPIERIIEANLQFLLNAWKEEKSKHVDS